jgi:hypothetical protein
MQGTNGNRTGYSLYVTPKPNDAGISNITALEYNRYDGGDLSTSAKLVPAGQWAHYVAVFAADKTITLYVNATPSAPRPVKGPLTLTSAALFIAGSTDGYFFPGSIDEVAIYDKALSLTQIAAHRAAGGP